MMRQYLLYAAIALTLCPDLWGSCRRQAGSLEGGATVESIQKFFKGIEESNLGLIQEACDEGVIPSVARVEVQNLGVSVLMTGLDYAGVHASSADIIDWLVENGGDVNTQNDVTGSTPLMFALAVQQNQNPPNLRAVVSLLRRPELDVGVIDKNNRTALQYALAYCPAAAIGLLTAVPIDDEFEFVDTPAQRKLFQGITNDNCDVVMQSLDEGADLNKGVQSKGITPLVHAFFHSRRREVFDLLYEKGVDFRKNVRGLTPLMMALTPIAQYFDNECRWAHWMLERPDFNVNEVADVSGRTALHSAVDINNISVVELLLEKGADPLQSDVNGITPFSSAAMKSPPDLGVIDALASFLHRRGNHIDVPTNTKKSEKTVINWVLQRESINVDLLKILARYTRLDEKEPLHGTTLLMRYLGKTPPNYQASQALLEAGADSNIVGNAGWPAIAYVLKAREFNEEFANNMLDRKAKIDIRNATGQTLFMFVLAEQKFAAADWLLSKRPDLLDATDDIGWTAVHHALRRCTKLDDIRYLHQKGASLNGQLGRDTPLSIAISLGKHDAAILLADLGANVNALNGVNMTPLCWALQHGNSTVVQKLLEKGARPDMLSAGFHPLLYITTGPSSIDAKIELYKLLAPRCDFSFMDAGHLKGWDLWLAENTSQEQMEALITWEASNLPDTTRLVLFGLRNPDIPVGCRIAIFGK